MFLEVITGSNPSIPSFFKISSTEASGLGVILSIMDQGKETLFLSLMYPKKPASAVPVSVHFSANALIAA